MSWNSSLNVDTCQFDQYSSACKFSGLLIILVICSEKKKIISYNIEILYIFSRLFSSSLIYVHTSCTPNLTFSVINVIPRTPCLIVKIVTYIFAPYVVKNIVGRNTKNTLSSHLRCGVQLSNVKYTLPPSANSVVNTWIILLLISWGHLHFKKNALKGTSNIQKHLFILNTKKLYL